MLVECVTAPSRSSAALRIEAAFGVVIWNVAPYPSALGAELMVGPGASWQRASGSLSV
jgi:hypothetical protein